MHHSPGLARAVSTATALTVGALAVLGAASAGASPATSDPQTARVVVVGMTGVRSDDVNSLTTPALWELSRQASVGLVAARGAAVAACPAHGWLAVSTGARAGNLDLADQTCGTLRDPGTDGLTPGWSDYVTALAEQSSDARPGLLGDALARSGTAATGIGPGAAVALADSSGRPVGAHESTPPTSPVLTRAVRIALQASQLVVIDTGSVRDPGHATVPRLAGELAAPDPQPGDPPPGDYLSAIEAAVEPIRAHQIEEIDTRVGAVLAATRGSGATVLVVSLADSGRGALQFIAATGPVPGSAAPYGTSLLTSGSTRQAGLVQSTDITPTLFAALGLAEPSPALGGASIASTPGPATATARVNLLIGIAQQSLQAARISGAFTSWLVLALIALFLAAALVLTRAPRSRREPLRPALRVLQVASVALAATPVSSFLTGLMPWWRAGGPATAFWLVLLGWVAVITVLSFAGPWRRHVMGPTGVVATVTVLVLVLDALTGSSLVVDSPMGAQRILATRFYGLSNQAFALLATAGLMLAAVVASAALQRGRRTLAAFAVAAIGLALAVVDGAPALGSDFGGPPGIILGFAILVLAVSGRRVTWKMLLLIGVGIVVAMSGLTVVDWLRPAAERSHIGRFLATSLDGGLWDVVDRKLAVNLRVLTTSWRYPSLTIGGALLTALAVAGPRPRYGGLLGAESPLAGLPSAMPLLRPTVAAIGVTLTVAFLVNDSGIILPATGIAVAVPCLIAAAAQWRLAEPERHANVAARAEQTAGRTS